MIDTQQPFNIADITVSPTTDEISYNGKTLEIKSMTMKLICYFAAHQKEVVTRENLRENIWVNASASDHTINNHMYTLRQVFASLDETKKYFHTVTGSKGGYRLLEEVTQLDNILNDTKRVNDSVKTNTGMASAISVQSRESDSKFEIGVFIASYKWFFGIGIILGLIFTFYLFMPSISKDAQILSLTSMPGREQNPTISQDGNVLLYANRTNRNSSWEIYAGRLSKRSELLETKKVFSDQPRNENYVSISPNKKRIAFIRYPKNERGIYLADFDEKSLSGSNTQLIIPLETANLSPIISWLNDTQFFYTATIATSAPRKIFKYDLISKRSEPISAPPLNTFGDFAAVVSPNKKWLAIMRSDEALGYQLFLYDLFRKVLVSTSVISDRDRRFVSFSDDSHSVYFVDQEGHLAEYDIKDEQINVITSIPDIGYWPLKIPGKNRFVTQQDWGLSSLTNRVLRINNPQFGGDGAVKAIVNNGLSVRAITEIGDGGLIFASITASQDIELWKFQNGESTKLNAFNNLAHRNAYLSLNWKSGSDEAILSINDTCYLIDLNTGKDSPLCPANEALYAGRFSQDGRSIYLINDKTSKAVKMGLSGYPFKELKEFSDVNSIHEGEAGDFYFSEEPSFDIHHFDAKTGLTKKIIERTFVIERFSNNDFVVAKSGIYFMDRKTIRNNAVYFYDFKSKEINFVVASKDNYPHVVVSKNEQYIYLIESYDNDSRLSLIDLGG